MKILEFKLKDRVDYIYFTKTEMVVHYMREDGTSEFASRIPNPDFTYRGYKFSQLNGKEMTITDQAQAVELLSKTTNNERRNRIVASIRRIR